MASPANWIGAPAWPRGTRRPATTVVVKVTIGATRKIQVVVVLSTIPFFINRARSR